MERRKIESRQRADLGKVTRDTKGSGVFAPEPSGYMGRQGISNE